MVRLDEPEDLEADQAHNNAVLSNKVDVEGMTKRLLEAEPEAVKPVVKKLTKKTTKKAVKKVEAPKEPESAPSEDVI